MCFVVWPIFCIDFFRSIIFKKSLYQRRLCWQQQPGTVSHQQRAQLCWQINPYQKQLTRKRISFSFLLLPPCDHSLKFPRCLSSCSNGIWLYLMRVFSLSSTGTSEVHTSWFSPVDNMVSKLQTEMNTQRLLIYAGVPSGGEDSIQRRFYIWSQVSFY